MEDNQEYKIISEPDMEIIQDSDASIYAEKLSIHGSRGLDDERVKIIILEMIKKHDIKKLVTHGEPAGVCEVARKIAKQYAIPLTQHYLNFQKLRGAFEHRSKAVINDADVHLVIWDGKSKGTNNEMNMIQKKKLNALICKIEPTTQKSSVGFIPDENWDMDNDDFIDLNF